MRDKQVIDSIVVEGNNLLSDSRIRKQMYSKTRSFWDAVTANRRSKVQRESLGRDTLEVKYLYYVNGFLGVQVSESFEILEPDSTALVRVRLSEGTQFLNGQRNAIGTYPPQFTGHFDKIFDRLLQEGRPADLFKIRRVAFDMKTVLANHGYPYAEITFELDTISRPPSVAVTYLVRSDSLVHFGDVTVEGTHEYPESVVRRELKVRPDNIYRREDILKSQERLFESGYFSFPQLVQSEYSLNRLRPDFVARVKENRPNYVTVKTGAGQSELKDLIWDFSAGFGKRNLMGSRRIDLSAEYSFGIGRDARLVTHVYRARFTEPWFLGIRMPLILTGKLEPPIKSTLQDYTIRSWSASLATTKRFGEEIRTGTGVEYERVKISGVPEEKADSLKESEGISVRRKMYVTFVRDSRDDIFIPRRGSLSDLSFEYYGGFLGGDDNFFKAEVAWSSYQVVWPGWISATRIKGGWAEEFGESTEIPEEERLYLGGANTVRGFAENSLGPLRDDGSAEGARATVVFNQEFRWKTLQVFQAFPFLQDFFKALPLWQSIFFDAGNGFRRGDDVRPDRFAYSYGTGFQIISPAGPIRVDYARVIPTDSFDVDSRWHFTILYAF